MFVAWVVFPLVLGAISLGLGLLTERLAGGTVAGALLLPLGFAAAVVVSTLLTIVSGTAPLALPAVVALALVGLALEALFPTRPRRVEGLAWAAALAIFFVYGAPVIDSGAATFAGYAKLDDTASWLALTDHILNHGRSLAGVPRGTYEATLQFYLPQGYPLGSLTVFAIGSRLVGTDPAWTYQAYLSFQAALLALAVDPLLRPLVRSPGRRAVGAFVAAQPALLYGYALWGSVKEVVTVPLIAMLAALAPRLFRPEGGLRALIPVGVAAAAVIAVLNVGGGVWVACAVLPCLVIAVLTLPRRTLLARVGVLAGLAAVFALPALVTAHGFLHRALHSLTGERVPRNLIHPLSIWQVVGIWPTGDFRFTPDHEALAYVLIAIALAAAVWGIVAAVRRRAVEIPLYVGTALVGAAILASFGSPWVDAKVLATASPAILVASAAGVSLAFDRGSRAVAAVAAVVAVLVGGGVVWSNVEAWHAVWLAPRDQLAELGTIGKEFAGQGPALLNEPNDYGAAHFLRRLDAEAPGEIRWRVLPLRDGSQVPHDQYVDIDAFDTNAVLVYRTLVLPRTPTGSRPPAAYRLVRAGRFYDVWQRSASSPRVLAHLALGSSVTAGAAADCGQVTKVARVAAGAGGRLAFVPRPPPATHDLSGPPRSLAFSVTVPGGRYQAWLSGSFPGRMEVRVDGRRVGALRHRLEHSGQMIPFGDVDLGRGQHRVELRYSGADLHPGSAARFGLLDRFILGRTTENVPFQTIPPSRAHELCGRTLDWVEALAPS